MENSKSGGFCIECGYIVNSFDGLSSCPMCNSTSIPCSWKDQVNISINWHELRIIIMWAENWWNKTKKEEQMNPVFGVAERIRKQYPERPDGGSRRHLKYCRRI